MYKIVSIFNGYIREEILPNPFEFISENSLLVYLFRYLIGGMIIHIISFSMCGIFYNRGQCRVLGSMLYMFFYILNLGIIMLISRWFQSVTVICVVYLIISVCVFYLLNKLKEKILIV